LHYFSTVFSSGIFDGIEGDGNDDELSLDEDAKTAQQEDFAHYVWHKVRTFPFRFALLSGRN
jgi:hypothetical protein